MKNVVKLGLTAPAAQMQIISGAISIAQTFVKGMEQRKNCRVNADVVYDLTCQMRNPVSERMMDILEKNFDKEVALKVLELSCVDDKCDFIREGYRDSIQYLVQRGQK